MSEAVAATPDRIKRLIVESLNLEGMRPEMIEDEAPLFGEGLGLDSVDALELVVALEKEFGIKIKSQEIGREVFSSVSRSRSGVPAGRAGDLSRSASGWPAAGSAARASYAAINATAARRAADSVIP